MEATEPGRGWLTGGAHVATAGPAGAAGLVPAVVAAPGRGGAPGRTASFFGFPLVRLRRTLR